MISQGFEPHWEDVKQAVDAQEDILIAWTGGPWVLVIGYDTIENNIVYVNDPSTNLTFVADAQYEIVNLANQPASPVQPPQVSTAFTAVCDTFANERTPTVECCGERISVSLLYSVKTAKLKHLSSQPFTS